MVRRSAVLTLLGVAVAPADDRTEILEIVEPLAAALSEGNAGSFMAGIAEDAADRGKLRDYVSGLLAFAEVTSSVELISAERGRANLDWYMQLRARATGSVAERRRGAVTVRVSDGKVTEIKPLEFFRAPTV